MSSASLSENSSRRVWLAAAILIGALLFAYQNSFSGPFVFDDGPAITGNPSIRNLATIGDVLSPPPENGQTVGGRPVVNLTLALNYAMGGVQPRGYHIVNFTIHVLAALTLFGIVRRTLLRPQLSARFGPVATPLALTIAAAWALHPLLTESVTYVVQRAESLMGLFYLLTLYAFARSAECHPIGDTSARRRFFLGLRRHRRGRPDATEAAHPQDRKIARQAVWRVIAVLSCLLGMATKEVMASAPLIVLLYDRTFFAGTFRAAWSARWKLYASLAATWLLLAGLVYSAGNRGGTAGLGAGDSSWTYALTQCRAVVHYLRLAIWPQPLVFDYGMHLDATVATAAPFAALLILLLTGTVVALRRWPAPGFLGVCFFAILAPSSSVIPIAVQPMAEHRMYLPLAALVAFVVMLVYERLRNYSWLMYIVIACILSGLTLARNTVYRSELALWGDTAAKRPENARAQCHLGDALMAAARPEDALARYAEAVRLELAAARPGERTLLGDFMVNQGNALLALGRTDDAIRVYQQAIERDPTSQEAHYDLGCVFMESGRLREAAGHFEAALRLNSNYLSAHTNLGSVLLREGRPAEAIPHYEAVLRLEPGAKALSNLGLALTLAQRRAEGIARLEQALRVDPDFGKAHEFLADALVKEGRTAEAVAHYERAAQLNPADERPRQAVQALRGSTVGPR